MPSTNNIDTEFLATLYHESNISKIKSTDVKKRKWQGIAIKYCNEKNLPLMDYKILSRKWSKLVSSAQRNRSKGVKSNTDLESDFDCEPNYGLNGESDRNEDDPIGSAINVIDDEMQSQSVLQDPLNNEDSEIEFSQIGSPSQITFNFDNTQEDEPRIDERSDSISPPPVITSPIGASKEESALDKISAARKEAAEQEKKLQAVLLRTAEDEEKAKRELWVIKKDTAEKEKKIADQKKDMIDLKKKILEAEHFTALVKRNHAIHEYNKLTGDSVPIPQLPNID